MIYIIKTINGNKTEIMRFYSKAEAVQHYRLKMKELAFPDSLVVEELNDGD